MEHVMSWPAGVTGKESPVWARRLLLGILAFESLGAFVGGPMLAAAPDGHLLKIPITELHGVFPDFFIPGVLLTGLGVLNGVAFFMLLRRMPSAWLWVGAALGGFFIWFVVELIVCGAKSWAQAAWGLPVPVGLVAAWPMIQQHLWRRTSRRPI